MADRVLHWFVDGGIPVGTHSQLYELDDDYTAVRAWARVETPPGKTDLDVNFTVTDPDGVVGTLLATPIRFQYQIERDTFNFEEEMTDFSSGVYLPKGSIVRLTTAHTGLGASGSTLNVQLELNK